MRQAILILSNKTDKYIVDKYNDIKKTGYDTYLLYDVDFGWDDSIYKEFDNVFKFSKNHFYTMGYDVFEEPKSKATNYTTINHNCQIPVLMFYLNNINKYDYVWVIEDDVVFTGNWKDLFDNFNQNDSDLITSYLRCYEDEPNWYWWYSLKIPNENIKMYTAFNPIYRISYKGLQKVDEYMKIGWSGHFEALLPSIIKNSGLKAEDLNKDKIFYHGDTMRWDIPIVIKKEENMLYHPIKEKKIYSNKRNCVVMLTEGGMGNDIPELNEDRSYDLHIIVSSHPCVGVYNKCDFMYYKRTSGSESYNYYFREKWDDLDYDQYMLVAGPEHFDHEHYEDIFKRGLGMKKINIGKIFNI